MHAFATLATLAILLASSVHAAVYVTNPVQASQCAGGESCQVQWVDNGQSPLLTDIGECEVALYTGEYQLVQSLPSVNVATSSSFTFTPDPAAGPNGQYYIVFTASGVNYQGFSGSFSLSGMSGTTPGGGSSTPASTPATGTSSGSSTSAGSTTPETTSTGTASTPSGTSTPVTGTTTPTSSSPVDTTATPTLTTPTVSTTRTSTSTTPTTTRTTSTSASATPSSAAGRVGSSTSLGGLAALLVLSGVLAF